MKLLNIIILAALNIAVFSGCKRELKFDFDKQTSLPGVSIRGLCVVNDSVVWISGTRGTFAKTIDGGKTWYWDSIPGATHLDFRDIQAFDDNTSLVLSAGLPAKIYKTIDGGKNWKETYSDTTSGVFFDAMDFWDEKSGVAISDPLKDECLMIETMDGGESWTRIPVSNFPKMIQGEAHFAASGTCLVTPRKTGICFVSGGSAARIFISSDKGKTWKVNQSPLIQGKPSQGIFSIAVFDEKTACVVGGDYENPKIKENTVAYTKDGGQTWEIPEILPPAGFNSCVKYVPKTNGKTLMAVGTEGSQFSKDGGKTWQLHDTIPYHTIDFEKTGKFGWAAGSDGRVSIIRIK